MSNERHVTNQTPFPLSPPQPTLLLRPKKEKKKKRKRDSFPALPLRKLIRLADELLRDGQPGHGVHGHRPLAAQELDRLGGPEAEPVVELEVQGVAAFEVGGAVFGVGLGFFF